MAPETARELSPYSARRARMMGDGPPPPPRQPPQQPSRRPAPRERSTSRAYDVAKSIEPLKDREERPRSRSRERARRDTQERPRDGRVESAPKDAPPKSLSKRGPSSSPEPYRPSRERSKEGRRHRSSDRHRDRSADRKRESSRDRKGHRSGEKRRERSADRRADTTADRKRERSGDRTRDRSRDRKRDSSRDRRRDRSRDKPRRDRSKDRHSKRSASPLPYRPSHKRRTSPDPAPAKRRKHSPSASPPPSPHQRSRKPLAPQEISFRGTDNSDLPPTADGGAPKEREKPNYKPTGLLAKEANKVEGTKISLKYHEPPEARKPPPSAPWRLWIFKGDDTLGTVELHTQSCWLLGRAREVADIPLEHPSASSQHAAIQFRYITKTVEDEDGIAKVKGRVKPYIIDLDSSNGTELNGEEIEPSRYFELRDKDILKFGGSEREYMVMLPPRE